MTASPVSFATSRGSVTVAVDVPRALPVVEALFPDDRTRRHAAPLLTLRAEGRGYALEAPGGAWRTEELSPLLVQLELSVAEELVRRSGRIGLHAGGVVVGDGAALIPGDGGTGKSSLVAALAARGCPVLGDDVVLLDASGRAHAFRRLLKVEEPARTLLGLPAPSGPLADAWPEAAFYRPHALGSRWAEPAPVTHVVLPRRGGGASATLRAVRAGEALPGVVAGLVLRDRVDPAAFEAVVAALQCAACLELSYDATSDGAETLLASLA